MNYSRTKNNSHSGIKLEPIRGKGAKKKKLLKRKERNKNSGDKRRDDTPSLSSGASRPKIGDSDFGAEQDEVNHQGLNKTEKNLDNKVSQTSLGGRCQAEVAPG